MKGMAHCPGESGQIASSNVLGAMLHCHGACAGEVRVDVPAQLKEVSNQAGKRCGAAASVDSPLRKAFGELSAARFSTTRSRVAIPPLDQLNSILRV